MIARYAFPIKCTEVIHGDNPDDIVEIRAEYDPSKTSKPKVTGRLNLYVSNLKILVRELGNNEEM